MSILEQLMNEIKNVQQKHTNPTAAVGPYVHGPQGLFGVSGLERDVISSRIQPMGLASVLPVMTSTRTNPLYAYITGFQAMSGSQTSDPCDVGQVAGAMKSCLQTAQFGSYQVATRSMDITRVGQQIDRGEFMDLEVMNDPLVNRLAGLFPNLPSQDSLLQGSELLSRILEVGVGYQQLLSTQTYVGTGAGTEFPGLDILIGQTKVDAQTGVDCPALYSEITDFAYEDVTTPVGSSNITQTITTMFRYLNENAIKMNFGETQFALVMRTLLFHELTDIWPCNYMSYRCIPNNANASLNISGDEQVRMRDDMRNGNYLLIDGVRVPVITDNAILEENGFGPAGQYASDIYFIPLSVQGGRKRVTYFETFDFSKGVTQDIALGRAQDNFWTDGGRYIWAKLPPKSWCVQWNSKIEPRIVLLTPQLAGRILNVAYTPERLYRDPFPDQYNFMNGGVTTARPAPSYYSDWNPPA